MQSIKCSNQKCNKVVGEVEYGKARFKCKSCGTFTTIQIEKEQKDISPAPLKDITATAYVGRLV